MFQTVVDKKNFYLYLYIVAITNLNQFLTHMLNFFLNNFLPIIFIKLYEFSSKMYTNSLAMPELANYLGNPE